MDPPDLTKRRKLMSHAFTPKAIGKLEDGIRARAARMVDGLLAARRRRLDRRRRRRAPDVGHRRHHRHPGKDRPRVFDTLDRILAVNSPEASVTEQDELELFASIFTYTLELTAEKRRNPVDDIWSTLTSAVITDETANSCPLGANELEVFFFVLAFAGSDTTKNALAIGLQAFVAIPADRAVSGRRTIRSNAVEEVLRWATPVAFWTRSREGRPRNGRCQHIPKGERVVAMLRSANRDEEVFSDPFTFDIGRTPQPARRVRRRRRRTTVWAPCWRAPRSARCSTNCSVARRHHARGAEGQLPQPDEQHVDLRRDGDIPDAALVTGSAFGLVDR
jgi:cytochrome P450